MDAYVLAQTLLDARPQSARAFILGQKPKDVTFSALSGECCRPQPRGPEGIHSMTEPAKAELARAIQTSWDFDTDWFYEKPHEGNFKRWRVWRKDGTLHLEAANEMDMVGDLVDQAILVLTDMEAFSELLAELGATDEELGDVAVAMAQDADADLEATSVKTHQFAPHEAQQHDLVTVLNTLDELEILSSGELEDRWNKLLTWVRNSLPDYLQRLRSGQTELGEGEKGRAKQFIMQTPGVFRHLKGDCCKYGVSGMTDPAKDELDRALKSNRPFDTGWFSDRKESWAWCVRREDDGALYLQASASMDEIRDLIDTAVWEAYDKDGGSGADVLTQKFKLTDEQADQVLDSMSENVGVSNETDTQQVYDANERPDLDTVLTMLDSLIDECNTELEGRYKEVVQFARRETSRFVKLLKQGQLPHMGWFAGEFGEALSPRAFLKRNPQKPVPDWPHEINGENELRLALKARGFKLRVNREEDLAQVVNPATGHWISFDHSNPDDVENMEFCTRSAARFERNWHAITA